MSNPSVKTAPPQQPAWIILTTLLCSWALLLLLYHPSINTLWYQWTFDHTSYSHGPIILGIVLYLLYDRREQIADSVRAEQLNPAPLIVRMLTATLLAGASLSWAIVYLMDVQDLQWLLLPILMTLVITQLYGYRAGLRIAPILLFCYLAIPIWDMIVFTLQKLSVWANEHLLALIDIPAHINGIEVSIPYGQFEVAGGCSGLRYFLVSLTLAALYGYLYYDALSHRLALILFSMLVAITFNWIRIFMIIVIGYQTRMESSLVHSHETFGWILFAFALIPIFILANRLSPEPEPKAESLQVEPPNACPPPSLTARQPSLAAFSLALALLALGPLSAYLLKNSITVPEHYPLHVPYTLGDWQQVPTPKNKNGNQTVPPLSAQWKPNYFNSDQAIDAHYQHPEWAGTVHLAMRLYFKQTQGQELINYLNSTYDPEAWLELDKKHLSETTEYKLLQEASSKQGHPLLIHDYFLIAGERTQHALIAKLLQLKSLIAQRQDAIYIGFATDCKKAPPTTIERTAIDSTVEYRATEDLCLDAEQRLEQFMKAFHQQYALNKRIR